MSNYISIPHPEINAFSIWDIVVSWIQPFIKDGFIISNTLKDKRGSGTFEINGDLQCLGDIVISVSEFWTISTPDPICPLLSIKSYRYDAFVEGYGNIFRFDNTKHGSNHFSCHKDRHHKHNFDIVRALEHKISPVDEIGLCNKHKPKCPSWTGDCCFPRLKEILEETRTWHCMNYNLLPNPDHYADKPGREN